MELKITVNPIHIIALSTLAMIFLSPLAQAEIGIGAIVIDSQIEGKGDFKVNDAINVGDIITTGPKGNVTILFNDESMLTLGPNAKAQIVQYSETPAPGVSEIKIISGGFNYFPGIILEKGGKQVLNNTGGINTSDSRHSGPNINLPTEQPIISDLNQLNEQLTDISSLLADTNVNNLTSELITPTLPAASGGGGGVTGTPGL